jgi:KaiC/GvpD/RAD55 family RecA-like ATPase
MVLERLSTGVDGLDALIEGGIPRGFFVAVTGEPGCGKTILSIHFTAKGVEEGDRCVYVTTEESRNSILTQADMLGMDLKGAVEQRKLVIIDALMGLEDRWSLSSLDVEHLLEKVIEAKKELGYGRGQACDRLYVRVFGLTKTCDGPVGTATQLRRCCQSGTLQPSPSASTP